MKRTLLLALPLILVASPARAERWVTAASIPYDLDNGIRSGFSYSGATTMEELHAKSEFVFQTVAGQLESSTHILGRK